MKPWKLRGDTITFKVTHQGGSALAELCEELVSALDAQDDAGLMRRLVPNAYPDDPDASDDFRRFTSEGLLDTKRANAVLMLERLETSGILEHGIRHPRNGIAITLSKDDAWAWLRTFTDLRQHIAARLDIERAEDTDRIYDHPADDEEAWQISVFEWVADLQHSLVSTLDGY